MPYLKGGNLSDKGYVKEVRELVLQKGKLWTFKYILKMLYWRIEVFLLFPFYHYIFDRYFYFRSDKIFYSLYSNLGSNRMGFVGERMIEIPLAKHFIENTEFTSCLEIGNVMQHHFLFEHEVLDKYEVSPGVINEDVSSYMFSKKYDLIISISTLEHVGFDESEKEPGKVKKSILNIFSALAKGGTIFISVPCGYNPEIDEILKKNEFKFDISYYQRNRFNSWSLTTKEVALGRRFNYPYPFANALAILILHP